MEGPSVMTGNYTYVYTCAELCRVAAVTVCITVCVRMSRREKESLQPQEDNYLSRFCFNFVYVWIECVISIILRITFH